MAGVEKKKKCTTIIPQDWPRLTGPKWEEGSGVAVAQKQWRAFLREQATILPTPRIYRKKGQ